MGEAGEVEGRGDQGLPRARGRVQDDVPAGEQLEDGLLLRRVEAEPEVARVVEEALEEDVGVGGTLLGQPVEERGGDAQGDRSPARSSAAAQRGSPSSGSQPGLTAR